MPKAVLQLRRQIEEFELALKSDLGIFVDEYADATKRFGNYKDVYKTPVAGS
jgi:hypothetical protein